MTKEELPACPVATTVALIGSKWKLLVLRNLRMRTWRFNELQRSLEGVSQKVLASALRDLERDGLVERTVYAEVPPRVEYNLTELGRSLEPIIAAMEDWGRGYQELAGPLQRRGVGKGGRRPGLGLRYQQQKGDGVVSLPR